MSDNLAIAALLFLIPDLIFRGMIWRLQRECAKLARITAELEALRIRHDEEWREHWAARLNNPRG
jgi:hypothetical protein